VEERIEKMERRSIVFSNEVEKTVIGIMEAVRERGDKALVEYVNEYDSPGLQAKTLKVTKKEMKAAEKTVKKEYYDAIERAACQIESFHRMQLDRSWIHTERPGVLLGQLIRPVSGVGIYAPGGKGGKTPLVSSVLMGAIPAKIAGVEKIVLVSPATEDGGLDPHLLVAAKISGVDEIYKVGSAWAIAALAYGTRTVPRVDVIAGPGNIYVTLAKKLLIGTVGIDIIAGPSEILVIADETADPDFIAADLLSQAEHDPLASSVLITNSVDFAGRVQESLEKQLKGLSRRDIAEKSIRDYGAIVVTSDIESAILLANRIAPEHLELVVEDSFEYIGQIQNAGAIFIGQYTPEPVGDYVAGPNHVLPTAGTARFASALSVDKFFKKTSLIHYSPTAFKKEADIILRLSEIEGLDAHSRAVKIRLEKSEEEEKRVQEEEDQ
jgi:histidinol dehydrogenase